MDSQPGRRNRFHGIDSGLIQRLQIRGQEGRINQCFCAFL